MSELTVAIAALEILPVDAWEGFGLWQHAQDVCFDYRTPDRMMTAARWYGERAAARRRDNQFPYDIAV